jgi:hypothetical protein
MMPMALNRDPRARMIQRMNLTVRLCRQWLGEERCHQAETQALAYFVNLCILYLWGARERPGPNSVVDAYAQVIDYLLSADKSRS